MAQHDEDRLALAHLTAEVDRGARRVHDGERRERPGGHRFAVDGGHAEVGGGIDRDRAVGRGGGAGGDGGAAAGGAAAGGAEERRRGRLL